MIRPSARVRRILALAWIEGLHLRRDRLSLALIVTVPMLQIVLFGFAVDFDPHGISVAVAGGSPAIIRQVNEALVDTGYFAPPTTGLEPGEAVARVRRGVALIGVELPVEAEDAPAAAPEVFVDASDPATVRPAMAALESAYWRRTARLASLGFGPEIAIHRLYNPKGLTTWAVLPGLVGVVAMISMLMLGALSLVREREAGSWETLLATPVEAVDALVGKLTPYLAIGLAQAGLVVLAARVLFDLPIAGSLAAFGGAMAIYILANLALGFAFSALARNQMQALQGAVLFYLPSMLLSGFMFPFEGMPRWARALGELLPLTHFVRIARGVLLRGGGTGSVLGELWPVILFAIGAGGLALWAYWRRLD
jgi:ABC-2 type transport system permease protein